MAKPITIDNVKPHGKKLSEADEQARLNLIKIWDGYPSSHKINLSDLGHYLNRERRLTLRKVLFFSSLLKVPPESIRDDYDYGYRPIPEGYIKPTELQKRVLDYCRQLSEEDQTRFFRLIFKLRNGSKKANRLLELKAAGQISDGEMLSHF